MFWQGEGRDGVWFWRHWKGIIEGDGRINGKNGTKTRLETAARITKTNEWIKRSKKYIRRP